MLSYIEYIKRNKNTNIKEKYTGIITEVKNQSFYDNNEPSTQTVTNKQALNRAKKKKRIVGSGC